MTANTVNITLTPNGFSDAVTLVARDEYGDIVASPADILRVTAGYLTDHGWHQGDLYADLTVPCPAADVTGAIRAVVYGYPVTRPVLDGRLGWHVDMAIAALADTFDDSDPEVPLLSWLDYAGHAVTAWNDDHNQTRDRVLVALLIAADHYDNCSRTRGEQR